MASNTEPKIVLFDIESMPIPEEVFKVFPQLSRYYGLTFKADINSIICFGYKIFGEKETHCLNSWDYNKSEVNNDKELCKRLSEILNTADCIVTHNGKKFDLKFINTRLAIHKLPPLPKIIHIDTLQVARSNYLLFSNRLGHIGQAFVKDDKLDNGGWGLWHSVYNGDKKAREKMSAYCKQDVKLLEKIFKKMRPLISNIPNYAMFTREEVRVCPKCGSSRVKGHGNLVTTNDIKQRFYCKDCEGTFTMFKSNGISKSC